MAAKKKATFEEELAQVEAVLERMEAGGQPIEEALKDYEAGLKLIAGMEKELADRNVPAPNYHIHYGFGRSHFGKPLPFPG